MKRLVYVGLTGILMLAGLASRHWGDSLPAFVSAHLGDALWAGMIYGGFRVFTAGKRSEWALGLSLVFCFAIEFSQLYQAEWINGLRSSTFGALVLGKGFLAVDLIRYAAGIAVLYVADKALNAGFKRG